MSKSDPVQWADAAGLTLMAGGCALEYRCWGPAPGDAPTVVLLHEGLGCVALWRDFPQRLQAATGWGVCAYSRAGYGASDATDLPRPTDYMTREACDVLPDVLDAVGVRRSLLLGHSDGASIAAIHAGSVWDPRVRGLVLIAPHFFTEPMGLSSIAKARDAYANTDLREKLGRYHRDVDVAFGGWNDAWLSPQFQDWDIADVLDHIRVPVQAIQGRDDQYGTLAQIEAITDHCPAPVETLILDACGHAPQSEHPEPVLQAIVDFCTRLSRIEAAGP